MSTSHRRSRVILAATLAAGLVTVLAAAAAAQPAGEPPLPTSGLEEEVRALNRTLGKLVGLLERQLEGQTTTVLMQRVQLMTNRLAPLEQELRDARAEARNFADQIEGMEVTARQVEAQHEAELESGGDASESKVQLELMRIEFDLRQKQFKDRQWEAQQRVIDLEQRLDRRRAEIETWESEIDRYLGLR